MLCSVQKKTAGKVLLSCTEVKIQRWYLGWPAQSRPDSPFLIARCLESAADICAEIVDIYFNGSPCGTKNPWLASVIPVLSLAGTSSSLWKEQSLYPFGTEISTGRNGRRVNVFVFFFKPQPTSVRSTLISATCHPCFLNHVSPFDAVYAVWPRGCGARNRGLRDAFEERTPISRVRYPVRVPPSDFAQFICCSCACP